MDNDPILKFERYAFTLNKTMERVNLSQDEIKYILKKYLADKFGKEWKKASVEFFNLTEDTTIMGVIHYVEETTSGANPFPSIPRMQEEENAGS